MNIDILKFFHFIVSVLSFTNGANILGLMSAGTRSHFIWNRVLVNGLEARGHNLTVLSADIEPTHNNKNLHYIHLERAYEGLISQNKSNEINEDLQAFLSLNQFQLIPLVYQFFDNNCLGVIKSKGFQTLLNYPDDFKFDLVILDFTLGPCTLGFLHKFGYPPMLGVSPFNNPPYILDLVGSHVYPAYVPFFSTQYDTNMNFIQRLYNTAVFYADYIYRQNIFLPKMDKMVRPFFSPDMPYIDDLQRKAQLVLVNSHPSTNYPEPTAPNVIEVGGLQITEPEPLPNDIAKFINESKSGAVLFSLGTNVKSEFIGSRRCKMILDVISEFPNYNFLWKIDSDFLDQSPPKNLLTKNWFPQRDILAHPKIKAFVTHAGGLSTHEAIWFGVPMVGMPVLADQHRNLHRSIVLGLAVKVDIVTMTKEKLYSAVKTILEDKTYSENIKRRSKLYQDRPMKPLDTAIWWIEYVLRTKNLEHLRSPVMDLGVWKGNSFDVVVFVTISLGIFILLLGIVLRKLCRLIASNKKGTTKKHKLN